MGVEGAVSRPSRDGDGDAVTAQPRRALLCREEGEEDEGREVDRRLDRIIDAWIDGKSGPRRRQQQQQQECDKLVDPAKIGGRSRMSRPSAKLGALFCAYEPMME
ncbi:hypothetical protein PspLS_10779 [Pyricularia sp. CBS 133598]|nr:hypothetical protein PspLS_10779 [Pyricularia sp. CBS 133598]